MSQPLHKNNSTNGIPFYGTQADQVSSIKSINNIKKKHHDSMGTKRVSHMTIGATRQVTKATLNE